MTQAPARTFVRPDPQKIVVPRKHGQVLVEPTLAEMQASLSALPTDSIEKIMTFGRPLDQMRVAARRHFLEQATLWAAKSDAPAPSPSAMDRPWIITGHQVEFYHAGVWAKVVAADAVASRAGAVAFDLLVDHDTVDHLGLDIPTRVGDSWQREPALWADATSIPADGLNAPTREQFDRWDAEIARHPLAQTDSMAFMLSALRPSRDGIPYAQWLSRARSSFERAMDLNVHHIPTSLLCTGDLWHTFVQTWATKAEEWIAIYNKHLATYRAQQGIKNPQHPMPDLSMAGDTVELPFWIYKLGQPRERLVVQRGTDIQSLLHDGVVIRPRALALTMFVRLFFADLFIHGIGGALYDQITDRILQELFGIIPSYGCVSAAWLLPLGRPLENTDDIAALKWRRHHVAHNPQLAIDPFTALKTDVAELIRDRRVLIEQIAGSLATHRRDRTAKRERRERFRQLHTVNEALHQKSPRLLSNLDHQIDDALRAQEQNKVLLWREYFFALHTMDSLKKLITAIQEN